MGRYHYLKLALLLWAITALLACYTITISGCTPIGVGLTCKHEALANAMAYYDRGTVGIAVGPVPLAHATHAQAFVETEKGLQWLCQDNGYTTPCGREYDFIPKYFYTPERFLEAAWGESKPLDLEGIRKEYGK